jgi:hypothetical protein
VLVLLAGLMLVDVLPNMLKSLYTQYSQTLVFSYGVFAISFLVVIFSIVGMAVIRDLPAFFETATFGWRTQEAYFSGEARKEKKTDKRTDSK